MNPRAESHSLTVHAAEVHYGARLALGPIEVEIAAGQLVALVGPNGSGKSTLLRLLAGIQTPSKGEVKYQGRLIQGYSSIERARIAAYLGPELNSEFPMLASEAVSLGLFAHGRSWGASLSVDDGEKIESAMVSCACWQHRSRPLNELSSGERQLVALARGLVQDPQILMLDETLGRMDIDHQERAGQILFERIRAGKSVVLVSHDLQVAASTSTEIFILKSGQLLDRGPTKKILSASILERLYPGVRWVEVAHPEGRFPILLPRR